MAEMRRLKRAVIKEEFVALTGDYLSALILNQMIYWLEKMNDFDKFIQEEITRTENNDSDEEINMPLTHGWVYKKSSELVDELMLSRDSKSKLMSEKTIRRHIEKLVEAGWLDKRKNIKYKWDRTYQYRVNLVKISEDLEKIGYSLQGYAWVDSFSFNKKPKQTTPIVPSNGHNVVLNERNVVLKGSYVGAIPEITTEINKENITNPTHHPSFSNEKEYIYSEASQDIFNHTPDTVSDPINQSVVNNNHKKEEEKERDTKLKQAANQIIGYLNGKTGKHYKYQPHIGLISGRIRDGYSINDFIKVIDNKVDEWIGTDMEKYLRPATLFAKSHFDEYLNQKPKTEKKHREDSLWAF